MRRNGQRQCRLAGAAALILLALAGSASAAPPPNDDFEDAARLPDPPATVDGTLAEATRQEGEPDHLTGSEHTVWYSYRPSSRQAIALDTCQAPTSFDTVLSVYTGSSLDSLELVAGNDDACGVQSRVEVRMSARERYWIAVSSFSTFAPEDPTPRDFRLRIRSLRSPGNDDFARARPLTLFHRFSGSTRAASREFGEPRHGTGRSVWFRYRAEREERLTIDTRGSRYDTILSVYRGRSFASMRRIRINDDAPQGGSEVTFMARPGATYYVALDGFGGGSYRLTARDDSVRGLGVSFSPQPRQTLEAALARGLRGSVGCRRPCRLRIDVLAAPATARRAGLANRLLARSGGWLETGDPESARLRFTPGARRALARLSRATVIVRMTLVRTKSPRDTRSRRVTLR